MANPGTRVRTALREPATDQPRLIDMAFFDLFSRIRRLPKERVCRWGR